MTAASIGFIGLGKMGAVMAPHVATGGHHVTGYDISPPAVMPAGVELAADLAALAGCGTIITMLPDGDVVSAVIGALLAAGCDAMVIDMSSSHPDISRAMATDLAARGQMFIDAPVSGGVGRAESGELMIMAGGSDEAFAAAQPLLALMGTPTLLGPAGCGHAMKALNTYVSAAGLVASFEALATARDLGIAPDRFLEVINRSTGRNNTTEAKIARYVVSEAYDSGFDLKLMAKDVAIAASLAETGGFDGPVTDAVRQFLQDGLASLGDAADHTELYLGITKGRGGS